MFSIRSRLPALRHLGRFYATEATGGGMPLTFASPGEVYYNKQNVKQVDVPSYNGYWGILPNHVPVLGVLKPGVVAVYQQDGTVTKYFVSSGSVTVNEDSSVQVLAEEAAPLDRLDSQAINSNVSKAQQELNSASTDAAKAEAQIQIDCYEALKKACEQGGI